MSEVTHKSHFKEYMIIFFILAVLTVFELIVPELKVSFTHKAISLTLLAFAKAFCVGYYYMHLKDETKWLKFIALIPISAFFYFVFVCLESYFR